MFQTDGVGEQRNELATESLAMSVVISLKEFIDVMNTRRVAATRAGVKSGRVTVRNRNHVEAPRLSAASSTEGSIPLSAAEVNR